MKPFHRTCTCCDRYHAKWESELWDGIYLCDVCVTRIRDWAAANDWLDHPLIQELVPYEFRRYNNDFYLVGGIPKLRNQIESLNYFREAVDKPM